MSPLKKDLLALNGIVITWLIAKGFYGYKDNSSFLSSSSDTEEDRIPAVYGPPDPITGERQLVPYADVVLVKNFFKTMFSKPTGPLVPYFTGEKKFGDPISDHRPPRNP